MFLNVRTETEKERWRSTQRLIQETTFSIGSNVIVILYTMLYIKNQYYVWFIFCFVNKCACSGTFDMRFICPVYLSGQMNKSVE